MQEKRSIYLENNNPKLNKSKVVLVILIILLVVMSIIIILNVYNISRNYQIYKQYEQQISEIQEKEKQKELKKEQERQAKLPKLTEQGKYNIEHIYKSETKRAFLTFDDGPSSITPDILDILKNENVKATFFVLGSNVEKYPETLKRIYNEGHFIANHGYSHVYTSIYASPQSVLDEFNRCNDAVKNVLGESEYNSHLFRFPGGLTGGKYAEIKQQANQLLLENNIIHVDWNALTGDAEIKDPTIDFEIQKLKETTQGKNSVVILMHDAQAKKVTAEALPQIITYLKEQGYEIVNFYDVMK